MTHTRRNSLHAIAIAIALIVSTCLHLAGAEPAPEGREHSAKNDEGATSSLAQAGTKVGSKTDTETAADEADPKKEFIIGELKIGGLLIGHTRVRRRFRNGLVGLNAVDRKWTGKMVKAYGESVKVTCGDIGSHRHRSPLDCDAGSIFVVERIELTEEKTGAGPVKPDPGTKKGLPNTK